MKPSPNFGRVLLQVVALISCLLTLSAASRAKLPKTEIPLVIDMGVIWLNSTIKHKFKIENSGDAPLRISGISCGTSRVKVRFDEIIAPGESGYAFITVNTERINGRSHHICTFTSNDPAHKMVDFAICYDKRELIR